ncbi:hypothetical protein [Reichenbachiella versicolor]|uniref:hypothetical protein n=1 Tax=Reichenbachiella versicolor TaxID=1821036 RepID=UPI000D6E08E6|nr:hypothetical protein [Reichenbachiella versicolor]
MIVSKPNSSTLLSLSIFLAIAFGLFIYGMVSITSATDKFWWTVLIYSSGPIGVMVTIKVLTGIKTMRIGKAKFEVKYPFRIKNVKFEGSDIQSWKHESIKTYGGQYDEITWILKSGKKVSLSKQENSDFDKTLKYMNSKFSKIKTS